MSRVRRFAIAVAVVLVAGVIAGAWVYPEDDDHTAERAASHGARAAVHVAAAGGGESVPVTGEMPSLRAGTNVASRVLTPTEKKLFDAGLSVREIDAAKRAWPADFEARFSNASDDQIKAAGARLRDLVPETVPDEVSRVGRVDVLESKGLSFTDDAASAADGAADGALARKGAGGLGDDVARAGTAGGAIDDIARGGGGVLDDVARAGGSLLDDVLKLIGLGGAAAAGGAAALARKKK